MPRPESADIRCSTVDTLRVALHERGAERRLADVRGAGGDVDGLQVGAAEHDAGIDRRRPQHHQHLFAGVQAHAGGADGILEGALSQHESSRRRRP